MAWARSREPIWTAAASNTALCVHGKRELRSPGCIDRNGAQFALPGKCRANPRPKRIGVQFLSDSSSLSEITTTRQFSYVDGPLLARE
jgi:hypothetical protein